MKKRLFYVATLALLSANAQEIKTDTTHVEQLEEVFLTDSRFRLNGPQSGRHIIKITREEIEKQQFSTLASLINTKSGIEINGSRSNAGQNLSYYFRGGNNRQVLVLIDGIQMTDPSQIASDFDIRLIDMNQIDSIEIIKGAASTLYGNSAASGVINITTKKSSKKELSGSFSSQIGSNQTSENNGLNIQEFNTSLSVSGTLNKFNYALALGQYHVNGISAVANGTEKDPFNKQNASLRFGFNELSNFSFNTFASVDGYQADFDNSYPLEDASFQSKSKQFRIGISPKYTYTNGSLNLNVSFIEIERKIISNFPNNYKGKRIVADFYNKYNIDQNLHAIIGVNYSNNEALFQDYQVDSNIDPYLNVVWNSPSGFNFNFGGRLNNHSEYGSHFIYNINPSMAFKWQESYIIVFGSYSTSFIAPSLSQLFGPFGANPDLEPESNETLELGLAFNSPTFKLSALFFKRNEKNFIDYVTIDPVTFESQYQNVSNEFDVSGLEFDFRIQLLSDLSLNANYTFTDKKDKNLRIPKHKANASLDYMINTKTFMGLRYQYTDQRTDLDFTTFQNVDLDEFSTIDILFNHQLIEKRLKISAGITNLLNTSFTELIGYAAKGRNYNMGIVFNF